MAGASDYSLDRMAEADRYNAWLPRSRPPLPRRGREVVALEPHGALLEHLRRNAPSATVVEGAVDEAPPGPFDSAVCFNVVEHIADDRAA